MERIKLGPSEIEVSRFCFGTWNIATRTPDWGPADEKAAIDLIHGVLETGCNFVDTAKGYGDSEVIVGKALAGCREEVILATKLVHCDPAKVEAAVSESLTNLQTDYIDLFICHWPSQTLPLEPFLDELARERDAGRIRALGVSNFNLEQMKIAKAYGVVSLQPPFSLVWRFAEDAFAFCREQNIAVTPYSPLAQGLLTGRYSRGNAPEPTGPRKQNLLFSERMFPTAKVAAQAVDAVADRLGCSSSQVALAWVLKTPGITAPVVGASSLEQWKQNLGALDIQLSDEDYQQLDQRGQDAWGMVDPEESMWGWKPA